MTRLDPNDWESFHKYLQVVDEDAGCCKRWTKNFASAEIAEGVHVDRDYYTAAEQGGSNFLGIPLKEVGDHFHRAHPILFRCFARGEVLDAFLTSAVVLWLNMPADRQYDGNTSKVVVQVRWMIHAPMLNKEVVDVRVLVATCQQSLEL